MVRPAGSAVNDCFAPGARKLRPDRRRGRRPGGRWRPTADLPWRRPAATGNPGRVPQAL